MSGYVLFKIVRAKDMNKTDTKLALLTCAVKTNSAFQLDINVFHILHQQYANITNRMR